MYILAIFVTKFEIKIFQKGPNLVTLTRWGDDLSDIRQSNKGGFISGCKNCTIFQSIALANVISKFFFFKLSIQYPAPGFKLTSLLP